MDDNQTTIPALEGIELPLFALRTALTCASEDDNRHYLKGVYVHAVGDEYRIAATDGHRLFVYSTPIEHERQGASVPEWVRSGVILPAFGLKERLGLLAKLKYGTARISYQVDAPHLLISDQFDSCTFRMSPVDGTFAEYQTILDKLEAFNARELGEMASTAYNAGYLKEAAGVAAMLGSDSVRVFPAGSGEPTLITFPACSSAILILMAMRDNSRALNGGAAKILQGAVSGTIAALTAHQTRWRNKAENPNLSKKDRAEAEKRVRDYEKRIAAVKAAADVSRALPAPEAAESDIEDSTAPAPAEQPAETAAPSYAIAGAVEPEAETNPHEPEPLPRRLTGRRRDRALLRFRADVAAILSRDHGLTLSQISDGVPLASWFDIGLSAEKAAFRCLDWHKPAEELAAEPAAAETEAAEPVPADAAAAPEAAPDNVVSIATGRELETVH